MSVSPTDLSASLLRSRKRRDENPHLLGTLHNNKLVETVMYRAATTPRIVLAIGAIFWLGLWAGGCQRGSDAPAQAGSPKLSTGPELSLDDAVKLSGLPKKHRVTASVIAPDNSRLFVSLDDREGTLTLGTVPLAAGGKFERWGTLKRCVNVFSVAWAPSGEEAVALVARLESGDPPVYETSIFTCTKGQQPVRRQVLSEEPNPKGSPKLAWPRPDAVCLLRNGGIDLLELASGKSQRLYEADKSASLVMALHCSGQGVIEFVQQSFEAVTEPQTAAPPQLVRLGLDGKILGKTELARGADTPILGDSVYIYGGFNVTVKAPSELHSVRVFARDTNRLMYKLPLDLSLFGTPNSDQFVGIMPVSVSRDGGLMVCICGNAKVLEEGFDTVLFKLLPP